MTRVGSPDAIGNGSEPSREVWARVFEITEYAKLRRQQDLDEACPYSPGMVLPREDWGHHAARHAAAILAMTAAEFREARGWCAWWYGGGIVRYALPYIEELDAMRRPGLVAAQAPPPVRLVDPTRTSPLASANTPENARGRIIWDYIQLRRHIAIGAPWDRTDMPPLRNIYDERAAAIRAMSVEDYRAALVAARSLFNGRFPAYASTYLAELDRMRRPRAVAL